MICVDKISRLESCFFFFFFFLGGGGSLLCPINGTCTFPCPLTFIILVPWQKGIVHWLHNYNHCMGVNILPSTDIREDYLKQCKYFKLWGFWIIGKFIKKKPCKIVCGSASGFNKCIDNTLCYMCCSRTLRNSKSVITGFSDNPFIQQCLSSFSMLWALFSPIQYR